MHCSPGRSRTGILPQYKDPPAPGEEVIGSVCRGMMTGCIWCRHRAYGDGPDHRRIMEVWQEYVRLGADILFVDEESGRGGLDVPASCLGYCDELRTTFKLPVGLFLYGPASQAGQVRAIAPHVDVIGEMGYNLSPGSARGLRSGGGPDKYRNRRRGQVAGTAIHQVRPSVRARQVNGLAAAVGEVTRICLVNPQRAGRLCGLRL